MLVQCCVSVEEDGPILYQHWLNITWLLGLQSRICYYYIRQTHIPHSLVWTHSTFTQCAEFGRNELDLLTLRIEN